MPVFSTQHLARIVFRLGTRIGQFGQLLQPQLREQRCRPQRKDFFDRGEAMVLEGIAERRSDFADQIMLILTQMVECWTIYGAELP